MSQNKCIQILIHVEEENVQLQLWCMHVLKFSPWGRKALIKNQVWMLLNTKMMLVLSITLSYVRIFLILLIIYVDDFYIIKVLMCLL